MRLRYVAKVNPPVSGLAKTDQGLSISFLPLATIWADSRFDPSQTVEFSGNIQSYNPVAEGDLLLPKVAPTFSHGRVAIAEGLVNGRALATSEVFVIRCKTRTDTRFLKYRLMSSDFRQEGVASWIGVAGLKRISADYVRNTPLDAKAWSQRGKIADFLDRECARIGELLSLSAEQEARLLSIPMTIRKASLAGLGESVQLRRVAFAIAGSGFPHEEQGQREGELPFVKASDLQAADDGRVVAAAANYVSRETAARLRARVIPVGASIFPRIGAAMLKNTRRVAGTELILDNNLVAMVARDTRDGDLLFEILNTVDLAQWANPGPVPSLGTNDLLSIKVPWGAPSERHDALERIQRAIEHIRPVIEALRERTRTVLEYRDALITEAVGGQLDVSRIGESQMEESIAAAREGAQPEVLA